MTETKSRIVEFEALRGLSIFLLLLLHAHVFGLSVFGLFALNPVSAFVGAFLLGAFFFLGGYFFDMSIQRYSQGILKFIRSRLVRERFPWIQIVSIKKVESGNPLSTFYLRDH